MNSFRTDFFNYP